MIGYASNSGTRRNLAAPRAAGWRILITPYQPYPREGLRFGIDNGAWRAYRRQEPFDEQAFSSMVERHGGAADFVVLPDIVAGGEASLDFSMSWLPGLRGLRQLLLPVQDGMEVREVAGILRDEPQLGLFFGWLDRVETEDHVLVGYRGSGPRSLVSRWAGEQPPADPPRRGGRGDFVRRHARDAVHCKPTHARG